MERLKTTFLNEKELFYSDEVYEPKEDSFLLAFSVKKEDAEGKNCLDIGCGSGIQSVNLCLNGAKKVIAVDLNEKALEMTRKNAENLHLNIEARKSNLFEDVKEIFDVIVFNPPYLVSEEIREIDVDGGKGGREVIDRFLSEFDRHLNKKGIAYLLQSNLNGLQETEKKFNEKEFSAEVIGREKLFFEELVVFRAERAQK